MSRHDEFMRLLVCVGLSLVMMVAPTIGTDVIREKGRCSTYGISDTQWEHPNLVNNTVAQPITPDFNTFSETVAELCPSLAKETHLCCDATQFGQLVNQIQEVL